MKSLYNYTKTLDLHFFRHGQSIYQCQRLISGDNEYGLSGLGKVQTHKVARNIKHINFDLVLSSDLKRAVETWEIISNYFEEPIPTERVIFSHFLREKNQGVKQMQPLHCLIDKDSNRVHKFEGGESWQEVHLRVETAFQVLMKHFISDYCSQDVIEETEKSRELQSLLPTIKEDKKHFSVLIVTHFGFIKEFFNIFKDQQEKQIMGAENKYIYYAQNATLFQVRLQLDDVTGWRSQIIAMNSKDQLYRPFQDDNC